MSFKMAEAYIEKFGMADDKMLFYKIVDYVALSVSKKHIDRSMRLPDITYGREIEILGLVDPMGLATEKGEALVREVNPDLYEMSKGL
ncbi:MAG: hypothetical protein HY833_02550 [Candidatus Aenigmarchaeota archaeon]|nr:hypothetical protein [Candidatus Aenigmarchaeota archaeon]